MSALHSRVIRAMRTASLLVMLALAVGCTGGGSPSSQLPESGAALFVWNTFYDTDLEAGDFFDTDHSLTVRFMAQYERAYEGTLVATPAGPNQYSVAFEGDSRQGPGPIQPHITIRLGGAISTYDVPHPLPETAGFSNSTHVSTPPMPIWRHLFVIRRNGVLEVWLDGDHLCRKPPLSCDLSVGTATARGHLRLGKREIDPTTEAESQFYGFIDDVGVFDRALTTTELNGAFLTGSGLAENTTALRFGFNFDRPQPGTHIHSPSVLTGTARIVAVGAQHASGVDAPTLPIVAGSSPLELPFFGNETWEVVQEFSTLGSHAEVSAFSWDFVFVPPNHPVGQPQIGGALSEGRKFVAASAGTVHFIQQQLSGPATPNFIVVQESSDEFVSYMHLRQNSAVVTTGATVAKGAALALVSNVGTADPHLHIALLNGNETPVGTAWSRSVTRPAYFVDYCASDDFGVTWSVVRIGMPRLGQWVHRMPASATCP
jgi:Peptidase family M23